MKDIFIKAFESRDLGHFMSLFFPPSWNSVAARIIESGAEFSLGLCDWAPRWSRIPLTIRNGKNELETAFKSCLFRAHDCIHQLWGLLIPSAFDKENFYIYKRSQMCGEVAVLTLTEFELAWYWYNKRMDLRPLIDRRNAIPMLLGPLYGKSILQIAQRMDGLLHKKSFPRWAREHTHSTAFIEDYVPMLELDRFNIDNNWKLMREANWFPFGAPNSRYNSNLDGLELTQWMVNDFYHLQGSDPVVDEPLSEFNRQRRSSIILPTGWNSLSSLPKKNST